jgi:hypothetical protein
VVLDMLDGVPLPPGFSVAPLLHAHANTVLDRYQLGAKVTGAVACAWLDRWVAARNAGDARGVREAVGALATSQDWRVLHGMQVEGDYPGLLWQYADAAAANAPIADRKNVTIEQSYGSALGCARG